jgi:hypothetical protein
MAYTKLSYHSIYKNPQKYSEKLMETYIYLSKSLEYYKNKYKILVK